MVNTKRRQAIYAAIGVYTLWGFSFLASAVAQNYVKPFALLAYRFDIALIVLTLPLIFGMKKINLKGKNIKPLLLLGTMEPCLYFIGEQYGIRYTNSAFSGLMVAVIPIITLLLAIVFLKEKPGKAQWFFSLLSIAGIIVITLTENSSGGDVTLKGFMFLCMAVICGSAYAVISRKISDEFTVFERTYFMQLMAAVFYTVLTVIQYRGNLADVVAPISDGSFVLAVLYLAIGASVAGYALFNFAVSNAPTANVISLCNLTTVISVLAGILILGDDFSVVSLVSMAAVIVGIWGVQRFSPDRKK